ncbi:MAG: LysM peptidoglycan-binding domain-containing protein, partial [Planctomycetia bacterium]
PESFAEAPPAFESPRNTSRFQTDDEAVVQADAPVLPPAEPTAPFPARRDPFVAPAGLDMPVRQAAPPTEPAPDGAAHVASAGDSWWGLAERAYGDGRLYRALFAWNRSIDPRISLAPGTRLEIPPRSKLEAAWPKLMPAE